MATHGSLEGPKLADNVGQLRVTLLIASGCFWVFLVGVYVTVFSGLCTQASVVTVPLMAYRLLMLIWSFWLAASLLNWLKWGWNCFSSNGLWKKAEKGQGAKVVPEQK
ncbi:hypothetical protein [Methyloglobulus sp.]|uniref:hypothetical protein n=1 Tax=Methyloglobulus sp. TaxID=2518622 RepID=UPI0039899F5B